MPQVLSEGCSSLGGFDTSSFPPAGWHGHLLIQVSLSDGAVDLITYARCTNDLQPLESWIDGCSQSDENRDGSITSLNREHYRAEPNEHTFRNTQC